MSKCKDNHTKYQPKDKEWKCPSCGISDNGEHFYIDESSSSDDDCIMLHENDYVVCTNCNNTWTGKQIAKLMAKAASMVPCPHCKGTGFVKSVEAKK